MAIKQQHKDTLKEALKLAIADARQKILNLEKLTLPISPENSIGRISRMEAIGEKSINEASLATVRQQLVDLEYAVTQINEEDFGLCEECGEPIAQARLLLLPGSRLCVKCAE